MLFLERSAGEYAINKPLIAEVDSAFSYSSGTTNILCGAIKRTLGREENLSFPRNALFNRMGMIDAVV